jgi:hypothetical protein
MESRKTGTALKRVEARSSPDRVAPRGIAPWKFVGGLMIHISVPAYVLLLIVTLVVHVLQHGTTDGLFSVLPRLSLSFIALYAVASIAGTGIAALAGLIGRVRRNRRLMALGRNPAFRSAQALSHAVGALGAMADDPAIDSALRAITDTAWHHDDERYQQVARDLDKAAGTYAAAYTSARGEQRQQVFRLTAETLGHFAQKLDALAHDTGTAATRNAQTMAGYIASKYGDDLDVVR